MKPFLSTVCCIFLLLSAAASRSGETGGATKPKAERPVKFPLPPPSQIGAEKFSTLLNAFLTQGGYEKWKQDLKPRPTGPYIVHPSGEVESRGTHGPSAVKVYYSPEVWTWLERGSKGLIPDGGTIVKLLYARNPENPVEFSPTPTGFSVMVKDSKASWDGWFYSDGGPLQFPLRENAARFFDPNAGFAISCINCHASTDNPESTYSSVRNVFREPIKQFTQVSPEGLKKALAPADIHNTGTAGEFVSLPSRDLLCWPYAGPAVEAAAKNEPAPLPFSTYDHVVQGPRPDGQKLFITSSNCMACHNAVQLYSVKPNMTHYENPKPGQIVPQTTATNLSPYSEWRYSMMGFSGRDPVFFAQLESERALYPEIADRIDQTCLSCHAVMGQRQFARDSKPDALFTNKLARAEPGSPHEKYGALSRDGVSCMVCHQMLPEGLGTPAQYSGKFKLPEKSNQVFGPYEKAATLPMETAMGLTPKHGPHLSDSKLCASCHAVKLPSLEPGRKYTDKEFAELLEKPSNSHHEQTTYLEWKNSNFSTEQAGAKKGQSCQDCHMPRSYQDQPLRFKIANIEDETFPEVDHRASDDKLRLELRDRYSRHALHGINLFVIEMFNQNPWLLGVQRRDNLFPCANVKSGFDLAIESGRKMATEQTATVEILSAKRDGKRLIVQVQVTNLAGHKFPSGVNLRRAFLEFKVQAGDKTLWVSGATDKWGVIGKLVDGKFNRLDTEFLKDNQYQPHHRTITREDQVQIYEHLIADSKGDLTTSFLRLEKPVKDNRLLPQGWKADGPDADATHPVGTDDDPDYRDGTGKNVVTYEIPLDVPDAEAITVSATLYYQTLAPYYLQQRFALTDQPDTQRLNYLVSHLDQKGTAISDWKLKIAGDTKKLDKP